MALLGDRRAELVKMGHRSTTSGFIHMEFKIPARSLMGLKSRMLNATKGEAIMHHTLLGYEPVKGELPKRPLGVLISNETGTATAYSLDALYDRGVFFVRPGDQVYEGQVVGENCRAGDLVVNVVRAKKLTNVRAAGKDENAQVRPVREMSLEACAGVHRGRRAGRDHAQDGAAAQDAAHGKRPQTRSPQSGAGGSVRTASPGSAATRGFAAAPAA